jgi:hypothetical protein
MKCDGNVPIRALYFLFQREDAALQIVNWTEVNEGKKPGVIIIFKDTNLCWHLFTQSHLVRKGATELFDVSAVKKFFVNNASRSKIKNGMHNSYIPFDFASA